MHHRDRTCGEELERAVARSHRVHAVAGRPGEAERARGVGAVERQRRAGQRARPERRELESSVQILEAAGVPSEHFEEREPVVRQPDRLRPLQMGVARQDRVQVLGRAVHQDAAQLPQAEAQRARRVAQVQREVRGHLVVATASGM